MSAIQKKLDQMEQRLIRIEAATAEVLDSEGAARFLHMSKSTLEKISSPKNMLIPVAKIGGKKKLFIKKGPPRIHSIKQTTGDTVMSYENETFKCEDCGGIHSARKITRRASMPGQYCPECGDREKCGACGEVYQKSFVVWKSDVNNYICEDCQHDYQGSAKYIRPIVNNHQHQPTMHINR